MKEETIITNEQTGAKKASKLARFDLIPADVLYEFAEHYGKAPALGKYEPYNWTKGYNWSLSYAALNRHLNQFWAGEDLDEEYQSKHVIAAMWHCAALAYFMEHHKDLDDRHVPGAAKASVEPTKVKQEIPCKTCKHYESDHPGRGMCYKEHYCFSYNKWERKDTKEPEEERVCDTCKYNDEDLALQVCVDCDTCYHNWEPKEPTQC